jgi:hypothetical protein
MIACVSITVTEQGDRSAALLKTHTRARMFRPKSSPTELNLFGLIVSLQDRRAPSRARGSGRG